MTQQEVIKAFMAKLNTHGFDNSDGNVSTKMLDAAIRACSRFNGIQDAINNFMAAQSNSTSPADFLRDYCGIVLPYTTYEKSDGVTYVSGDTGNTDTGAITGSDTGGSTTPKTAGSIVPESGNKYTAGTVNAAQIINTGTNDWIVVATKNNDTITSSGADSIDAGAGSDKITVSANYATIKTGAGSDTVTVGQYVNDVTLTDLTSDDTLKINGIFKIDSAEVSGMC